MKDADIEAGKKNLAEYLTNFYGPQQQMLSRQPVTPVAIDPPKIAVKAKEYQSAERAKGHEVSATEAVEHILAAGSRG